MTERRPKRAFAEDTSEDASSKMRRFGSNKSSRVCRHFAKGYCQLGDQCGFSHTAEQSYGDGLGASGYEQPTFAQQSGLQGPQPRPQTPYDAWSQGPQQYPTPGQSEYPTYSPYGPQGAYGARPPTNVPGIPDVYNPYGTTPTYSGPPAPTYPGYTAYAPPTSAPSDLSRRKSSTVCRHFAKGYCRLGDTCLFSHTPSNGVTPSSGGGGGGGGSGGASGKIRCRHWARGHCKLESQCRFLHDGEAGKGGTESTTASSSSTSTESA
jgi:hypothetical protein